MNCPKCGHEESMVIDTRPNGVDHTIRRRRECTACGKRFTTYEHTMEQMWKLTRGEESEMKLNEYQALAMRTSNRGLSKDKHFMNGILGLAGEVGECCDVVKKHYYQDGREVKEKLLDELGDVMWYIAETAQALGYSLEEIAEHNLEKLKMRYPEGFDAERSLHRD